MGEDTHLALDTVDEVDASDADCGVLLVLVPLVSEEVAALQAAQQVSSGRRSWRQIVRLLVLRRARAECIALVVVVAGYGIRARTKRFIMEIGVM